jgi:serine/threonine protein kinase
MFKVGSPLYMPPETLKESLYSLKNDSFALGVLLFYLLTRQYPWPGTNNS